MVLILEIEYLISIHFDCKIFSLKICWSIFLFGVSKIVRIVYLLKILYNNTEW